MRCLYVIALIGLFASCKNQGFLKQKYTRFNTVDHKHDLESIEKYEKQLTEKTFQADKPEKQKVALPLTSGLPDLKFSKQAGVIDEQESLHEQVYLKNKEEHK